MGRKPLGPWVVVGVDGSADALAAVDLAVAEAAMRRLRLRVVAASPEPVTASMPAVVGSETPDSRTATGPGSAAWLGTAALAGSAEANRAVAQAATLAHLDHPDLTVRTLVSVGDPAEMLISASRTAGVVVVGGRGRGGGQRPGSVCAQVAAHALCPTFVVPSDVADMAATLHAPVLVGVEAAGRDEAAIGFAFEEAAVRGVPLLAAHVWSGAPAVGLGCVDPSAYELRSAWTTADLRVAEALSGWAEKYPQVQVERLALYDTDPTRALLHACAQAGLVVLGASLHARYGRQPLGSISRTLIEQAGCPVCVVRLAVH